MVPKIADRGSSFKGAHQYYGHDKNADTSERVMFMETLNMRTDDPDKAWKVMAFTALHEEQLKKANGIHWNGQETEKPVYAFSLAWDEDQEPTHEEMKEAAISALAHRKMNALQAMLYGHDDTDHTHVHVVVNLIHPETGRTADIWHDQLELSEWAEGYEREHGGIRCEQRVENNQKRQQGEFVKHRDKAIQDAWDQSKTGQEFADNLEANGYMLAQGDKRTVIVDPFGKTMNPTRKIAGEDGKNIKAKMLNERLADLDIERLKTAEEAIQIQAEREYFDRDNYHAQQEEKNIDAAIAAERERGPFEDEKQRGDDILTEREYFDQEAYLAQHEEKVNAGIEEEKQRLREQEDRDRKARDLAREYARERWGEIKRRKLAGEAAKIRREGSFAEELDEIRAAELMKEKEAMRKEEIWRQQRVNIEESRKRGLIPDNDPPAPEPEIEPPEPQYEPPEHTNPIPDYDHAADLMTQHEQAATPSHDTASTSEATPEQEQSRDSGGYER